MSAPTATYCEGCGFQLGLEPIAGVTPLRCPDCKIELDSFAGENGCLHDCGRCGAQFVDNPLLRDLLQRRAVCGLAVPRRPMRQPGEGQPVRYVPCPACAQLMGRKNFGGTSGIIVDVCRDHGVWFDAGELPRVLEFVESGGLVEQHRRDVAELNRRRAELRVAAVDAAGERPSGESTRTPLSSLSSSDHGDPSVYHSGPAAWQHGFLDDARDVVATILTRIGESLHKSRRS
jgi:Zn-finger nucleic acid-binding protein